MTLKNILQPTNVLALFFFLVPWQTRYIFGLSYLSGTPTEFATLSLYATQVFLLLGLVCAYVVWGLPKIDKQYRIPLLLGGAIVLLMTVSAFLAHWSIPALAGLLDLAFAALAFAALLDSRVEAKTVMRGFIVGLLLPLIVAVIQVFGGGHGASTLLGLAPRSAEQLGDAVTVIDGTRVLRAYGSFPHPNIFGGYLAVALAAVLTLPSLFAHVRQRSAVNALLALLLAGLVLTMSRSAALGLLLGLGLAYLVLKAKNVSRARIAVIPIATIVITLALGATLFAPDLVANMRGGGALEERSLSERKQQYSEWFSTLHGTDWIIGNGPRNYVFALADEYPWRSVWDYQPIHNLPLLLISELGLVGLLVVVSWSSSIDKINFARFPNREALAAFAMGNVILVILFFDHYLWSSWSGLALVAIVMAQTLRFGENSANLPHRR